MAKERLSKLQKYILQECFSWKGHGIPLCLCFIYWLRLNPSRYDFDSSDDQRDRKVRQKNSMSLLRSARNLEKKGLIHIGADEEMTIRLTEEGEVITNALPPTFPKGNAKITIRPLKFRPPRIPKEGSGPNVGPNQLSNRMEQMTKALSWFQNQNIQLAKDREFWGEAIFRQALDKSRLPGAFACFFITAKHYMAKVDKEGEINNKALNVHNTGSPDDQ